MNVFVDAARLIANLGGIGAQFNGAGSASYGGEYIASSVTSMSADALSGGLVGYKMVQQYRLSQNMSPEELAEMNKGMKDSTSLILKTLTVVDLVELMTGFGPPCDGADFAAGSQQLIEISDQLRSALPDDDWQGDASQAYAQQVTTLRTLAQEMAELDRQLADITKNQAEWVTHMRLAFGILKDLLMAAFAIELALKISVPQPAGLALAQTFATTVAVLGIGAASSFVLTLFRYSQDNADKANEMISKYQKLAPVSTGATPAESHVAAAPRSITPDFAEVSSKTTDVFSAVEVAPARPDASTKQSNPAGAADTSERRRVLEARDEAAPAAALSSSAPTLAAVAQMPGKAAQLGQSAGPRPIYPVSRTGQQAGLIEDEGLADDVADAAAAPGTEGVERAPIEFAAAEAIVRRAG
ncbi:putative alanine and glycine rich protein [Mycobacterium lentiflavum]|uniref:Putative alanine and glycine rich protein n=1 Tax=Mycobacterium lentiflavum TaxID=141349 RepID=A0A0E4CPB6_MYCLN|nr:EspA/EspE family type VII secretion system effector [Mycobacterium lentiflavum]CQD17189.1 putative alanine and glycine rich protein [Mycobacterium lentiflavum]